MQENTICKLNDLTCNFQFLWFGKTNQSFYFRKLWQSWRLLHFCSILFLRQCFIICQPTSRCPIISLGSIKESISCSLYCVGGLFREAVTTDELQTCPGKLNIHTGIYLKYEQVNLSSRFATSVDSNRPVQPQKLARVLKFWI